MENNWYKVIPTIIALIITALAIAYWPNRDSKRKGHIDVHTADGQHYRVTVEKR